MNKITNNGVFIVKLLLVACTILIIAVISLMLNQSSFKQPIDYTGGVFLGVAFYFVMHHLLKDELTTVQAQQPKKQAVNTFKQH